MGLLAVAKNSPETAFWHAMLSASGIALAIAGKLITLNWSLQSSENVLIPFQRQSWQHMEQPLEQLCPAIMNR